MKDLFCGSTQKYGFYSLCTANCSFNAIISCATVIFNILTTQALRKTTLLLKPLSTLLPSLAVSDLGVGLVLQPFYGILLVRRLQEYSGNCISYATFIIIVTFFSLSSLFGVMALSVDRFLAIHLHLRYQELVTHNLGIAGVFSV